MKKIQYILFSVIVIGLIGCGSTVTEETTENFKQVELPDSSIIYLNRNSKITYDKKFYPRKVKLEGEAFFSINDGETSFVVENKEGDEVTVHGTEFNMIVSLNVIMVEVEIGLVSISIGSGKFFKKIRRGQRLDFDRHDNGLHLGQAKHQHRNWISVMDNDFRKSGKFLKRSNKHAIKNFSKGGDKSIIKKKGDKGATNPKVKDSNNKKILMPKSKSGDGNIKGGKADKKGKGKK